MVPLVPGNVEKIMRDRARAPPLSKGYFETFEEFHLQCIGSIPHDAMARVMWEGFLCKRDFFPYAKEKNGAAWLERNGDFPLKGRKFPLTWHGPMLYNTTVVETVQCSVML
jgi:hypothetical protein